MAIEKYTKGGYLEENPTWHVEDSPWKAHQVLKMLEKNGLWPDTIAEVGCGAGEILAQLQQKMSADCTLIGYDISPQAIKLATTRANERLQFRQEDFLEQPATSFDVLLVIDLLEHVEDYFHFLRAIRERAANVIMHIPLNLSVQAVLRAKPLITSWRTLGHIHNFTKETALQALADTGYDVVDYFYTCSYTELPPKTRNASIARIPRKIAFSINQDLTARVMGGYSLLVLARQQETIVKQNIGD